MPEKESIKVVAHSRQAEIRAFLGLQDDDDDWEIRMILRRSSFGDLSGVEGEWWYMEEKDD